MGAIWYNILMKFRTVILLSLLTVLFLWIGEALGGRSGLIMAIVFAGAFNFLSYWYSDKIVLSLYRAKELSPEEAPEIHRIVEELAASAGIPKPKVYIVPQQAPNAFATGRSPSHAAVAMTEGILQALDLRELRGVLSHELSHIKNRDTLVQTIAATLGAAITFLARMAYFSRFFGFGGDDDANPLELLVLLILAPIAALLIQMAISRSREYLADETGAKISRDPMALASALEKLHYFSQRIPMRGTPATSHLFIVAPRFSASSLANLFATHPPVEKRIERLRRLAGEIT